MCETSRQTGNLAEESERLQKQSVISKLRENTSDENLIQVVSSAFKESNLTKAARSLSTPYKLLKFNEENFHFVKIRNIRIDGRDNNAAYISVKERFH